MAKKKLGLDAVLDATGIDADAFAGADAKEQEHKELKNIVENGATDQKAGRPVRGKSKATNKIAFVVDDEQLAYLENLTSKEFRTPNAVAKKLFLANYEIMKK